jgi:cytochrome c553
MDRRVCTLCLLGVALGTIAHADIAHYHMRRNLDDLRAVERYLLDGKLDQAKARAFLLAGSDDDAAAQLSNAKSAAQALRLEVHVAVACASCHESAKLPAMFQMPGRPPPSDHTSLPAWIARHRWATDRMREGLVGNSEDHWRAGLAVLSETSLPDATSAEASRLATKLQKRAAHVLHEAPPESAETRGRIYGAMLATCVACHSAMSDENARYQRSVP